MNAAVPSFLEAASPHTMNTYGRVPIALSHGQGCRVWDINGKSYLDALGGIAVNTLGHNHPRLVPALQDQIAKIIHSSNYYHVPNQEKLAAKLVELSGLTNVFFCSTGLEANEAALKLARKFGHDKGVERPEIVVYEHAFHGRSIATLSATGNEKVQKGFGPLVEGFIRVPLNDIEALKAATAGNPNVVAVFFETIQGEGGIHPMRIEYLQQVRRLCDERDWLLMIDEVQCGMGRTGKLFAHEWAGIEPDIMAIAKGIGGGFPLGACLATAEAAKGMTVGTHGSTYGGNPLAMAVGNAAIDLATAPGFLDHVNRNANYLNQQLGALAAGHPTIFEAVRGQGMMLGLKMKVPNGDFIAAARDAGLVVLPAGDNVVRLLPPLTLSQEEAREGVALMSKAASALEMKVAAQ